MRHRLDRVLKFWDRSRELKAKNKGYGDFVLGLTGLLLKNDVKNDDITTNSLVKNKKITAYVIAKESGVIAGLEEFSFLNKDLNLKLMKKDGDWIKDNEKIIEINGDAARILERERINLNLLQRMSGIATMADSLNKRLGNKVKIAATRKTLWGLLDKKAVSIGGGLTHRLGLKDGIIIKDNHLKILNYNFEKAINSVKEKSKYVEIEVENAKQALAAAAIIKNLKLRNKNLFAIMLDKIKPAEIKSIVGKLKKKGLYDSVLLEASGNITPENIKEYKDCGADVVSMGCLTNSARVLNMSLEISQILIK